MSSVPPDLASLFSEPGAFCAGPEETAQLGEILAAELRRGDVLSLEGPLGAGKTQFAKGVARGLGINGSVSSPTFALVHEYEGGRLTLAHFDFYRMESEDELETAGFDDCVAAGVVLAEWGDRFPDRLPEAVIRVVIEPLTGSGRKLRGFR